MYALAYLFIIMYVIGGVVAFYLSGKELKNGKRKKR